VQGETPQQRAEGQRRSREWFAARRCFGYDNVKVTTPGPDGQALQSHLCATSCTVYRDGDSS